jgi:hypothetical protein
MNNFIFSKNGIWGDLLVVESNRLKETIEYIQKNNIKLIEVNHCNGYTLKDIYFIKEVSSLIEGILVVGSDINLEGIESLSNLKMLNITDEKKYPIDFAIFSKLERCSLLWHKNYNNLNKCKGLKQLLLKKIKIENKDALLFDGMTCVEDLTFIQCSMGNLEVILNFPNLNTFEIFYTPTLKDIGGLFDCHKSLKRLVIENRKNINDYSILGKLTNLEFLGINDCNDLESLNFVKSLPKLNHISFVGTNVIDGNIAPCLGIKHVGFNNKKHYTHTYEGLKQING